MQLTHNIGITLGIASALALAILPGIWKWRRRRQHPHVVATVEAIPSLRVEGSYRAIRIILHNTGESKTTVEEIVLCRRPGWFGFGIVGPLVRLDGFVLSRLNIDIASRDIARLPVTLDVNGLWETVIPLEPENPGIQAADEVRQLEEFNEAVKVLKSGTMRYSIQLSCPAESPGPATQYRAVTPKPYGRGPLTCHSLDGWVSLASYRGPDFGL